MESTCHWSTIPPELALEITAHNADDIPTLCAMSLASKTTRSFAIIHLFSSIHFSSTEDVALWCDMVAKTPALAEVVKYVKFWDRSPTVTPSVMKILSQSWDVSAIPPFLSVEVVEYNGDGTVPIAIKGGQTTIFPRIQKLRLINVYFDLFAKFTGLIGACGRVKSLIFDSVRVEEFPEPLDPEVSVAIPDLTGLEELWVKECSNDLDSEDIIFRLIDEYPTPSHLRTFSLERFEDEDYQTCSLDAAEKVLQVSAPSLVNLTLDPRFPDTEDAEILEMFQHLPAFPALDSLTFWLSDSHWVEQVVNSLEGAPNLTRLNFRLALYEDFYQDVQYGLTLILEDAFPWGASESMEKVLTRKFPCCRRIVFQFCIPDGMQIHFRRGMRRRTEARLKERLEESGADIADYLHVEWLNTEFEPVVYRATNGKPAWGMSWSEEWSEPETEASDCESECSDELGSLPSPYASDLDMYDDEDF